MTPIPRAAFRSIFRLRADKKITIQRPLTVNGIQTWQDWFTVPAALEPLAGVEVSGAMVPTETVTTSLYIEFVSGVRPQMRVLYQGRRLEIMGVINLAEADQFLRLVCREVAS